MRETKASRRRHRTLCGGQLAAQFGDRRALETPNELPSKLRRSGPALERIAIHLEVVYVFSPRAALVEAEEVTEPRWPPVLHGQVSSADVGRARRVRAVREERGGTRVRRSLYRDRICKLEPGTESWTGKRIPGGAGTRYRGEPGHTRDTRAHKGTRTAQTNLTTIQVGTGKFIYRYVYV